MTMNARPRGWVELIEAAELAAVYASGDRERFSRLVNSDDRSKEQLARHLCHVLEWVASQCGDTSPAEALMWFRLTVTRQLAREAPTTSAPTPAGA